MKARLNLCCVGALKQQQFAFETMQLWLAKVLISLLSQCQCLREHGQALTELTCFPIPLGQEAKVVGAEHPGPAGLHVLQAADHLAYPCLGLPLVLWQGQRRRAEARELLSDTYRWFTEGFDTTDLLAAKLLLEELA